MYEALTCLLTEVSRMGRMVLEQPDQALVSGWSRFP